MQIRARLQRGLCEENQQLRLGMDAGREAMEWLPFRGERAGRQLIGVASWSSGFNGTCDWRLDGEGETVGRGREAIGWW
jgi:hypothetical protein